MVKARLLIVEDDKHLLIGLRDILEMDGYEVITAENGVQALDILRSTPDDPPNLIVSDIMMPHMNGMELLRHVRDHEQWVTIPFIFLTARGEKEDIREGMIEGVDQYLVKPTDADDLLIAIESRLRRYAAINQAQNSKLSTLKRKILTILNHEFRTPLTLVVAYADMTKDYHLEDMSPDQLVVFLRGINSGAERLRRLVENFIMLVELEAGDAQRTFEWRRAVCEDLQSIVDRSVESVTDQLKNHQLVIDLPPNVPSFITDEEYLSIALRELLVNAAKFSDAGSTITLSAEKRQTYINISVTDAGRGIPEHEMNNIWEMFYQIDREHTEDQGAGAGLTLVEGIAAMHKGRVDVKSTVNVGSTFTLVLPLT